MRLWLTGPPGSVTGPADTHQKFMAALAKAALAQDKKQIAGDASHKLFEGTQQQHPPVVQHTTGGLQASGISLQPAKVLIEDMSAMPLVCDGAVKQWSTPPQLEEVENAAAPRMLQLENADTQSVSDHYQLPGQKEPPQLDSRMRAIEASSRRMEQKIDQILKYCRDLAQTMTPL